MVFEICNELLMTNGMMIFFSTSIHDWVMSSYGVDGTNQMKKKHYKSEPENKISLKRAARRCAVSRLVAGTFAGIKVDATRASLICCRPVPSQSHGERWKTFYCFQFPYFVALIHSPPLAIFRSSLFFSYSFYVFTAAIAAVAAE